MRVSLAFSDRARLGIRRYSGAEGGQTVIRLLFLRLVFRR